MWRCKECDGEIVMIYVEKQRIGKEGIPSKVLEKGAECFRCDCCKREFFDFNSLDIYAEWVEE